MFWGQCFKRNRLSFALRRTKDHRRFLSESFLPLNAKDMPFLFVELKVKLCLKNFHEDFWYICCVLWCQPQQHANLGNEGERTETHVNRYISEPKSLNYHCLVHCILDMFWFFSSRRRTWYWKLRNGWLLLCTGSLGKSNYLFYCYLLELHF